MRWPTWMDEADLLAKSAEFSGPTGRKTLAEHTWEVLSRLGDQVRLRPDLVSLAGERLWLRLYWACFLHDFGKAATGFQQVLLGHDDVWKQYHQRHEVLSLGFVDWLFPQGHPDREWIVALVGFHHKDASVIFSTYGGEKARDQVTDGEWQDIEHLLSHLDDQIDTTKRDYLWRWLDECGPEWAYCLGINLLEKPRLLSHDAAMKTNLKASIFKAFRSFARWPMRTTEDYKVAVMLCRGLIFTADHSASAGASPFPETPLKGDNAFEIAERPLKEKGLKRLDHQIEAATAPPGSAIMIAPTGSGKTEAAMLWVAAQVNHRPAARLFYTLPYQASMNAMYERLATRFLGEQLADLRAGKSQFVTIQHSRALLKLYQDMMSVEDRQSRDAKQDAKRLKNLAQLNFFPVQIFSPYQMLKAAYSLKGYEAVLLDYTDALFIFDEIHAYEPKRLALIITMIRWLAEHYGARFLIMTATLPPMVQEKLERALSVAGEIKSITATDVEFRRSQRHTVHLVEGSLSDQIVERVRADWAVGKAVLVCLNRVADAQNVYKLLKRELALRPDRHEIVLLHGRFNGKDRRDKERMLLENVPVGRDRTDPHPFVMVATQVVEVSLDVDFDVLYTDPAPLEALIQRFGRVNRGRMPKDGPQPVPCPVYVFRDPSSTNTKSPYKPYDEAVVHASMEVLQTHCTDCPVDESLVTTMLGEIYQGDVRAEWEREYAKSEESFQRDILDQMKPFESADKGMWLKFYEMFDGIEVLPTDYLDEYYEARDQGGYLEASQYLVNISAAQYHEFCDQYRLIASAKELEGEYADHIDVSYDPEFGLDLDAVRQAHKQRVEDDE